MSRMIIVDLRRKGGQGRWVNMSQIPRSSLRQEKVCNEEAPKREFLAPFFAIQYWFGCYTETWLLDSVVFHCLVISKK